MKSWIFYSLLTLSLWGCMGFFGKMASRGVTHLGLPLLGALGGLIVFPIFLIIFVHNLKFDWHGVNSYLGLLAGVMGAAGSFVFYMAIGSGEATRVVAFTATYPVLTLLLSLLFLGEVMSVKKLLGVALTIAGIFLVSL
jgi:bacterial/archaeal transporter family protein